MQGSVEEVQHKAGRVDGVTANWFVQSPVALLVFNGLK